MNHTAPPTGTGPSPPWVDVLHENLAKNDQRIRTAQLSDGWSLVNERGTAIHDAMTAFFSQVVADVPPRGAFAIHALGGTGRREICPGSDVDLGIIVENIEEDEAFLRHVSSQISRFSDVIPGLGNAVKANAIPDLQREEHFDLKSLASLLDCRLLLGDAGFHDRIRQTCRQRATELGLDFVFEMNQGLQDFDRRYPQQPGDVGGFHVKNGIGGLRNFQISMWLYSFERWIPSVRVYEQVRSRRQFTNEGAPTAEVLDAVSVIFCVRCWIEQRRAEQAGPGKSKRFLNLLIDNQDMIAFLDRFGAEGLTKLNAARETIRSYRHEAFDRLLERGVIVPDTDGLIVWGSHGLQLGDDALFTDATETFYSLYRAQQRFDLEIDKSIQRALRKNIVKSLHPHQGFITILVSPGPVYPALNDWREFGVLDRLVPGFDQLARQVYQPGHRCAMLTRAARAMQRIENLEHLATRKLTGDDALEEYFVRQYRDLGASARGALRLALLTEEIPETMYPDDDYPTAVKRYTTEQLETIDGLSGPTLRTVEFLLLTKRRLLRSSETSAVQSVIEDWQSEIDQLKSRDAADTIRALALFAYAAFDFNSPPAAIAERLSRDQWEKVRNLTQNLLYDELHVVGEPFDGHYLDEKGQRIGQLLPRRLLASPHVDNSLRRTYEGAEILDPQRAHLIIYGLNEVVKTGRPSIELRRRGNHYHLSLFAWDFPGLFWRVAGALFEMGCSFRSTDLFAIPDPQGKATDGESLVPNERRLIYDALSFDAVRDATESWENELRDKILQRLTHPEETIVDNTGAILDPLHNQLAPRLTDLGGDLLKFSCEVPPANKGVRYAISRLLSEEVGANIESIARDGTHDWPVPRTNFYIRAEMAPKAVTDVLSQIIGPVPLVLDKTR